MEKKISALKIRAGKLKFKGDSTIKAPSTNLPQESHSKRKIIEIGPEKDSTTNDSDEIQIIKGKGRITSSGITIQGHDTKFMDQLSPGDAIIIIHPTTLQEETKIVRMVLSNVSMGISSSFSSDLISTTAFSFIKAPKDPEIESQKSINETTSKQKKTEIEAFGTYASDGGEKFVYRVRNKNAFRGYKIITEKVEGKSREDLLEMRSKKKSDR